MITVIVTPEIQVVVSVDGVRFTVYRTLVQEGRGPIAELNNSAILDPSGVRIVMRKWFIRLKRVPRLPLLEKGMEEFFRKYHMRQDIAFDCYALVNLVHGIEPHKKEHLLDFWEMRAAQSFNEGDVLFFVDVTDHQFHHAAIYIGCGLCVSVYGAGGDLEFSTPKHMKQEFGAKDILIATPKMVTAR